MKSLIKKSGWTFLILMAALVIATLFMIGGYQLYRIFFESPNWRRIEKDIGVKKGETYPTRYVETEFEIDPDWHISKYDIRTAWKSGVDSFKESSESGYMYILEVKFDEHSTAQYQGSADEHNEDEVICYKCKIYQGKGLDGGGNWAAEYTTTDYIFGLEMKKDPEIGNWEIFGYGYG